MELLQQATVVVAQLTFMAVCVVGVVGLVLLVWALFE